MSSLFLGSPLTFGESLVFLVALLQPEIGSGFDGTFLKGSQHNDQFLPSEKGRLRTVTNNSGGTIQAVTYGLKGTATNSETSITNSGNIYGTTNRAIHITGSEYTITNESGGLIRAGSDGSTNTGHILAVEAVSGGTNLTLNNYGTITAGANTIKTVSTGMTLTNHSGGTISGTADGSTLKTIFVDGNNNTIENYGTISGAGDTNSINVDSGITGTNIIIHGSSTITGERPACRTISA